MADPITASVLKSLAGLSLDLVKGEAVEAAKGYVKRNFFGNAQGQALENFTQHLVVLKERIERVSTSATAEDSELCQRTAMQPSYQSLVRSALVASFRTGSEAHRVILARLISERLLVGPDSTLALAVEQACNIISTLGPRHLAILATLARTQCIPRPPLDPPINEDEYNRGLVEFWDPLRELAQDAENWSELEVEYIFGSGCATVIGLGANLKTRLVLRPSGSVGFSPNANALLQQEWWPEFESRWPKFLDGATITPVGRVIGTMAHDRLLDLEGETDLRLVMQSRR